MSGYNNTGGYGYSQYDPYSSQSGNPYDQRGQNSQQYGQTGYGQTGYEMNTMPASDPNAILNQCREVERGIDSVEKYISQIHNLHRRLLSDADPAQENAIRSQADDLADQTKNLYRNLVDRMKSIKKMPESNSPRNAPNISKADRRLKQAITEFQKVQTEFRKGLDQQMQRQYRIVRPDATDAEVQEAVSSGNQQIFSQALIQSDRRGDAQKASQMVRARHEEIQKIERDITELSQLFNDLDAVVTQQQDAVTRIDDGAQGVVKDVEQANTQIDGAIEKARSRNRKKWWCLLISIIIIIIIVVVVVVAVLVTRNNAGGGGGGGGGNGGQ